MNLPYSSLHELAIELKGSRLSEMQLLPYNRFDSEHTDMWWLCKSPSKSAFPAAKLVVFEAEEFRTSGGFFCGLHVEKGVVAGASTNPNHTMKSTWYWHLLPNQLRTRLEESSAQITEKLLPGDSLQILISCGPPSIAKDWEYLRLILDGTHLEQTAYARLEGHLDYVRDAKTINDLAEALEQLTNSQHFRWVNVVIGTEFSMNLDGNNDTPMCCDLLEVLSEWI